MPGAGSETGRAHRAYRARRQFGSLDGLRCLAIVAVVWHHAAAPIAGLPATEHGFLGVDLFFVLSGFLIATLLLRERDQRGHIALGAFYARRGLRIFPPYYAVLLALAVTLGVLWSGSAMRAPYFAELPFYATYTSNWIHASTLMAISWSLAAEEQFYLAWPPLLKWLGRAALPALGGFLVVNQLVNFRLLDGWLHGYVGLRHDDLSMLQVTFTPIIVGVMLAHLLHHRRGFARVYRAIGHPAAAAAALGLVVVLANVPGDLTGAPRLAIHLSMGVLVAACTVREDNALASVLGAAPMRRVGRVSYGMYLFHLFALHGAVAVLAILGITGVGGAPFARFALCLAMTVAVAELSYRYFEGPILKFKGRFRRV